MITARYKFIFYSVLFVSSLNCTVWADQNLHEIQKQFNLRTISKSFSVPDSVSLTASLKAATEKVTPTNSAGYSTGCVGLGCILGQSYGYGSYSGSYARPYFSGYYGANNYRPYFYGR
ncbi:MAG: hypothetical protein Q8L82_03100 [Nitrosomonas sp.]|nr:hypothetical protein [Nitrosomonas sp.]